MINKLPILINTVLCVILLSSCKPMSLHMIGDEGLEELTGQAIDSKSANPADNKETGTEELDEASILALLKENNLLNDPDQALLWSLHNNHPEIAKWLICKQGADVNVKIVGSFWAGNTPLHLAAWKGYTAVVELLINAGAQVNERNNYRVTPLHKAADDGHIDVAELLINAGAEVNAQDKDGMNPLHWAADRGRIAVVELLIKSNAELNVQDKYGNTPLHLAAENNSVHVAQEYNNLTFFELLTRLNINSSGRLVRLGALNEVKAFRKLLDSEIFDKNLVGLMLSYGDLNLNVTNNKGKTPLDLAREEGYDEIVEILEGIIKYV
jgi:ankyrin repeat protein